MKRLFLAFVALSIALVDFAGSMPLDGDDEKVYERVDELPQFPGGQLELYSFLAQNINYPADAVKSKQQGTVRVGFVVNTDGCICEIKVVSGVCESLDSEAVRVMTTMPKWTPGKVKGKAVRTKFNIPVTFRLQKDK